MCILHHQNETDEMRKLFWIPLILTALLTLQQHAKADDKKELKYNLSTNGKKYVKAVFVNQVWLRYNQSNPGTTVNGDPKDATVDIGLRRTRMQFFGQLSDHVFFYMHFGMNNFNYLAQNAGNRKLQAFFHDALAEFHVFKNSNALKIGGGLTVANGLSRFSQPSSSTIMTADVPVFIQTTVEQTDEFSRKLSMFARGQLGKLDYRLIMSDPFPVQTNGTTPPPIGNAATFTTYGHQKQFQALLIYNLMDKEPNTTPYMTGTYLGDKKILNIEAGAIYQKNATWNLRGTDTGFNDMLHWSVAMFADMPMENNKYALSAYATYLSTDYGPDYIRNSGIMNPANGNTDPVIFNGAGNSYPTFGTGSSIYAQLGFRLPRDMFKDLGTLMPYVSYRWSSYDKLADPVSVTDAGINWLIDKHNSKLSLNYQLRPVFENTPSRQIIRSSSASSVWLQYQVSL